MLTQYHAKSKSDEISFGSALFSTKKNVSLDIAFSVVT
jgi:hypothetical protein